MTDKPRARLARWINAGFMTLAFLWLLGAVAMVLARIAGEVVP